MSTRDLSRQFIHITTPDVAEKLRGGEELKMAGGFTGDAVYITTPQERNRSVWGGIVRDKLEDAHRGHENPVEVPVTLHTDPERMYFRETHGPRRTHRQELERNVPHLLPEYDRHHAEEVANRGREGPLTSQNAYMKTLKGAGYQGMHVEHRETDETLVWDPSHVRVHPKFRDRRA